MTDKHHPHSYLVLIFCIINYLTKWSRILLRKLIFTHVVKKFPEFCGIHGPYPGPEESSSHPPPILFSYDILGLNNVELRNVYSSPSKVEEDDMGRECTSNTHMAKMNSYRILVGKTEGNRPLGRPRRRWEDNIKMTLR
jgi:hypothetical protein